MPFSQRPPARTLQLNKVGYIGSLQRGSARTMGVWGKELRKNTGLGILLGDFEESSRK